MIRIFSIWNNLCHPTLEKVVSKVGQHVLMVTLYNKGTWIIMWDSQICYVIQLIKCALRKLNTMYIWAYNVVILLVLRSRFKIERLEDNGKIFFF